jgi:phosphoenolpyruvate carboxylase
LSTDLSVDLDPSNIEPNPSDYRPVLGQSSAPLLNATELLHPLTVMHESLRGGGYAEVADGLLVDILRRVAVFGLTLCPLDLRQESSRHTDALDAVTRY